MTIPISPTPPDTTLIVGQGVAGTLLAFRLWQANKPFLIMDKGAGKTSSAVASGLINPVVVKHFGLSWMAETLLPEAEVFYHYLEKLLKEKFYYPVSLFRVFNQPAQPALWNQRRTLENAQNYMAPATVVAPVGVHAPMGGAWIKGAARIDVEAFLKAARRFFKEKMLLIETICDSHQIHLQANQWTYEGKTFGRVVFCQGTQSAQNPWLQGLPVKPLKGQLLEVSTTQLSQEFALSGKAFVLPQGSKSFKVGATWEHTLQEGTTPEAESQLLAKAAEMIAPSFSPALMEVKQRLFGFRPTVPDRRPLLGEHPDKRGLYVFNGLGSKGYMLAPWMSLHLFEHIFYQKPLLREVDLRRYLK